ncbi:unnamed protein product [Bursaphelenchus xylophilus]|uniref:(pine wood nematode) hypothetical protein n=1 Tax=Bursaphelenchus xylophilus TaxID=6326 RepID=A0A1I7RNQ2_BURXY|nr:unnamed protein product [Bursaphelenchus xylophilus]CAG9124216.1 unnamed protein product [Bursaphelenchus xylophilus]
MDRQRKRLSILKPSGDSPDETANLFDNIPAAKRRVSFSATKIVQQFHKEDHQFVHEPTNEILHLSTSAEMSDEKFKSFNKENERNFSDLEISASQGLSLLKAANECNLSRLNDTAAIFNQSSGDRPAVGVSNVTDVESMENTECLFPSMAKQKEFTVNSIQDTMMLFTKNNKVVRPREIVIEQESDEITNTMQLFERTDRERVKSAPLPAHNALATSLSSEYELEASRRTERTLDILPGSSKANLSKGDATETNIPASIAHSGNFSFHLDDHGLSDQSAVNDPVKENTVGVFKSFNDGAGQPSSVNAMDAIQGVPDGSFTMDRTYVKETAVEEAAQFMDTSEETSHRACHKPCLEFVGSVEKERILDSPAETAQGTSESKTRVIHGRDSPRNILPAVNLDVTTSTQRSQSFQPLLDIDVSTRFGFEESFKEPCSGIRTTITKEISIHEEIKEEMEVEEEKEEQTAPPKTVNYMRRHTVGNPRAGLSTIMETPSRPSSNLVEETPRPGAGVIAAGFTRRSIQHPMMTPQYQPLPTPSSVMATPSIATFTLPMLKLPEMITTHPGFPPIDLNSYDCQETDPLFDEKILVEPCSSLEFEAQPIEGEDPHKLEARTIAARILTYYNGDEMKARNHLKREYQKKLDAMKPDVEKLEVLSMELNNKMEKEKHLKEVKGVLIKKILKRVDDISIEREEIQRKIEAANKKIKGVLAQI